MKIICSRNNLLNGLNKVSKAVSSKTTMSILECILIEANNEGIKLTSNDMELGIMTKVTGEVIEEGSIALDARFILDLVKNFPENDITIETGDSYKSTVTCEKSKFNLIGKPGEEFPHLPSVEKNECVTLSQFTLKEVIRQTLFSISANENIKVLTGELFEIKEDKLKVVSLDGYRASIRNIKLKNFYNEIKAIVPGKSLGEISKILPGDTDKDVSIYFTDKHILFEFEDTMVVSRLIDGEYFNVENMLSADYETKIKINKRELLDCLGRTVLLIKEGDRKPIIITITDDGMEININSAIGSMNEQLDIKKTGKDIMIGFNPRFLIDALRAIDDEEIDMYMINPKAPCFIKDGGENYIYLVLPTNFTVVS